jgi:N-acyl homoserine lactone hydrolase
MHIHAIQTGTVAVKTRQLRGKGHGLRRQLNTLLDPNWTQPLPIYAWLIEHPTGLILVDTGETGRTAEPGYFPRWHPYYHLAVRAHVRPEEEIGPQIRALGFSPDDVRTVILTHMHTDHAGGLYHFPKSEIFVSRTEYKLAHSLAGRALGYLPQHWPSWFSPRLIDFTSHPLAPFPTSYPLTSSGDITLVPTPGHTPGHLSVIVQSDAFSVFLAGDTSYTQQLLQASAVDGVSGNENLALQTSHLIQRYLQTTPSLYLPSHDPESVNRLTQHQVVSFSAS